MKWKSVFRFKRRQNEPASTVRLVTWSALFVALGVLFPILFHLFGLGPVFLPMFLPILTAGFILPPLFAIPVGMLTPVFSFFLTQMPPFFLVPLMVIEGFFLSAIPSVFFGKLRWNFWFVLIVALLFDRILLAGMVLVFAPLFHLPAQLSSIYVVLRGVPGVFLNLVLVPIFVKLLQDEKNAPSIDVQSSTTRPRTKVKRPPG